MRIAAVTVWIGLGVATSATPDPGSVAARELSFRFDVLPILARQGCASAYCHGAATGQGGFKLSLFGSDPRSDYFAITEELDGRRLDPLEPDQSLLLKKPSRRIAHEGGRKLPRDSEAYSTVRRWIEQGARWAVAPELDLVGLRIERSTEQLRAIAKFRRGAETSERDVTHLAQLSSSDERVASVDGDGRISPHGPGKAYLFARFGNRDARTTVVRSFGEDVDAAGDTAIDRAWSAELRALGLRAAPRAPEDRVMRRLHLDLVGRPPTPSEIAAYSELDASARVRTVADRLAGTPEFATVWGEHLAAWLEIPEPARTRGRDRGEDARARRRTVRDELANGRTIPAIVGRLLRDRGIVYDVADPRDRAERFGRSLLGVRLGCARCHNHPNDRWSQADHLGFAALFADPRPAGRTAMGMRPGVLFHPRTGAPVEPRVLDVAREPGPRADFATVIEWFALNGARHLTYRNFANRVFAAVFGRGLVEAADDHRLSNPAVHEPLLAELASQLEADHGDLRAFLVRLVTTRLYAMSSEPSDRDATLDRARRRYLARRTARELAPRALRRAALSALGHPVGESAAVASPLARQLEILNGELLTGALARGQHLVDAIADFGETPRQQLRDLWLLLLTREPTAAELDAFLPHVKDDARTALRELAFALLASREFGSVR